MSEADAHWRALAEKALGGPLAELIRRTADGLEVGPLYLRRADETPSPWRGERTWRVAQRVDHPAPDEANRLVLLDLEGGADALTLVFRDGIAAHGFGLAPEKADLDLALAGVELDFIAIRLDAGHDGLTAAHVIADLVASRRMTSASLDLDLGFDPIGTDARAGGVSDPDDLPRLLDLHQKAGLAGRPLLADGRPYHEAGASEAQELAAILATGVAYLRRLEAAGLALDAAYQSIALLLVADADVFLSLAKFRAMRRLWARVATASGLDPAPARVHADTAWRTMTRYDPWTNVMRATAGCSAAGLGGADTITLLPFTLPLGLPDDGARRLARNLQRVLLDEAHLAKVEDPAAGAGGFGALTDALCAEAWRLFQEIETEGGIVRALPQLRSSIAEIAARRARGIARLTQGIVGTSRFASLEAPALRVSSPLRSTEGNHAQYGGGGRPRAGRAREATAEPSEIEAAAAPSTAAGGPPPPCFAQGRMRTPGPDALPVIRDAEPFEALRDRAKALADEGKRPRVFLATLGPPAAFGPRATHAANFFAASGIVAEAGLDERNVDSLVAAFTDSGISVACLCGPDAAYETHGAAVVSALRRAGARRVLLVGRADIGIDACIHEGCDALSLLGATLDAAV